MFQLMTLNPTWLIVPSLLGKGKEPKKKKKKSGRRETRRVDNQPEIAFSLITCAVEHL